ncbi:MAG: glucose-1-phosphate adenylyltransferase [Bacteroidetes bacterium CG12_big_fil_rev_8_21_14_0_65_60_17]|nr:MAG: glucose-1-phosphate adenylyltransferase [Bacteroidetes bacterium CG12_big_fil_rev_8_21_14_0_65_60_17]
MPYNPKKTIAMVLGGGAGTRLFPLTNRRSKPAVPLAGKYRLIDIPVSNCINSDINKIFVLTQYNSASLNRHLTQTYRFDAFRDGFVNILAAEQTPESKEWFQGTADAVRQSVKHLESYQYEHILILSGDQLYSMDYRDILSAHVRKNADISIATIPVHADHAPGLGILKTDKDERITHFHEKPGADELEGKESPVSPEMERSGRTFLASMGIYVFSRGVLLDLLDESPGAHDFGKEIIPGALSGRIVVSYPFEGYWSDIGTIRSFFDANLMLAHSKPEFDMYNPEMPLYTNARMLPPAKIQNSFVENSLIAEASVVLNAKISNCVIGLRSYVGNNVSLMNTVMLGSDYYHWQDASYRPLKKGPEKPGIGNDTVVEGAIIDRNACIGERCVIRNSEGRETVDAENYYIREGIIVIPKDAHIPDGTII